MKEWEEGREARHAFWLTWTSSSFSLLMGCGSRIRHFCWSSDDDAGRGGWTAASTSPHMTMPGGACAGGAGGAMKRRGRGRDSRGQRGGERYYTCYPATWGDERRDVRVRCATTHDTSRCGRETHPQEPQGLPQTTITRHTSADTVQPQKGASRWGRPRHRTDGAVDQPRLRQRRHAWH